MSGRLANAAMVVLVAATAVATPLGATGRTEWVRLVLVAAALGAFACTMAGGRPSSLTINKVAIASALMLTVAVAFPSRQSHDLYSYASYGRIVSHYHESPYRVAPAAHPADPIVRAMAPGWRPARSVYGPVFTAISAAGMAAAGASVLAARLLFQLMAALAVAACAWLLWRRTRDPAAVALVALNPVIVLSVVNGGHNDALVGLAVLAGVVAHDRDRFAWAGTLVALAVLVKIVAVLPLGALVLYLLVRRGWRPALAAAAPATGLIVGSYLLAGGATALRPIADGAVRESRASIWLAVLHLINAVHPHFSSSASAVHGMQVVAAAAIAVVAITIVWARLNDGEAALVAGTALMAYVLVAAYVLPWYAAWVLPVLALAWRSRLSGLSALHAGLLLFAYEDRPTFRHPSLLHRAMHGFWAYGLPAFEFAAVVYLVMVATTELRGSRSRHQPSREIRRAGAQPPT